jgi:hypothetical protein
MQSMDQPPRRPGRGEGPDLRDTDPLEDVRAELEEIEELTGRIGDLTAVLRDGLTPEQFRVAWELRDAVERLTLAERLLLERRMADELARLLPRSSNAMQAVTDLRTGV